MISEETTNGQPKQTEELSVRFATYGRTAGQIKSVVGMAHFDYRGGGSCRVVWDTLVPSNCIGLR